jgi:hypothetical protein
LDVHDNTGKPVSRRLFLETLAPHLLIMSRISTVGKRYDSLH